MVAVLFERHDHDDDAVLSQMLTVADHDVAHIADTEPVDENPAGLYFADDSCRLITDLQHVSRMKEPDPLLRDPEGFRDMSLSLKMSPLSVHRDRVLRPDQRIDELDVLLAGVSGNMRILENHFRSDLGQLIDDIRDGFLVARNRMGGEDDPIAGHNLDLLMNIGRHSRQRRHGLALAAGRHQHGFLRRIILQIIQLDQRML